LPSLRWSLPWYVAHARTSDWNWHSAKQGKWTTFSLSSCNKSSWEPLERQLET
jgi:hypothetical protein